jgi:hypothetical protein
VVPDEEAVEMPISHGFRITTELRFPFTIAGVGESPAFAAVEILRIDLPAVAILRITSQVTLNGHVWLAKILCLQQLILSLPYATDICGKEGMA